MPRCLLFLLLFLLLACPTAGDGDANGDDDDATADDDDATGDDDDATGDDDDATGDDDDSAPLGAGDFTVQVPSTSAGPEGLAVRVFHPAESDARYPGAAPVTLSVSGGLGMNALTEEGESPDGVPQGMLVVEFLFPGVSRPGGTSGGTYDFRGPDCRQALADVVRYAAGELADTDGDTLLDRVPFADPDNLGVVGRSNGGNLVLAALAEHAANLPDVHWFVAWESPVGDQFVTTELNDNPHYTPGTCAATTCPTPGLADALAWDPSGSTSFNDAFNQSQSVAGAICVDADASGTCEEGEKRFGGGPTETAPGLFRIHPSSELAAAIAARGPALFDGPAPPWLATEPQTTEYWDGRDGALAVPALHAAWPALGVIHVQTADDHVQSQPDHPHAAAHLQAWIDAGHGFARLNADAVYIAEASGIDAAQIPELDANQPVPWPAIGDAVLAETIAGTPTAPFVTGAAMAELADRTRAGEWSVDLDVVLD